MILPVNIYHHGPDFQEIELQSWYWMNIILISFTINIILKISKKQILYYIFLLTLIYQQYNMYSINICYKKEIKLPWKKSRVDYFNF